MNAVTSFRLEAGQIIKLSGIRYVYVDRKDDKKRFRNEKTGALVWVQTAELTRAFLSGELSLASSDEIPESRAELQGRHLSDLPERTQAQARLRSEYVLAMLANVSLGYERSPEQVIDGVFAQRRQRAFDTGQAFEERKPCRASVFSWRADYEAPGPKTIMRCVKAESRRGRRGLSFPEEIGAKIEQAITDLYDTPQRLLVGVVHDRVVAQCRVAGLSEDGIPSLQTVRRVVQRRAGRLQMEARRGKRAADLIYGATHPMAVPAFPGEVLEIDAHQLNLFAADEHGPLGRLWCTTAIDLATRVIMGFAVHVGPPSSLSVAACLRNAIAPKHYVARRWPHLQRAWPCWGVPVVVKLDNAFENKAKFLTEAADEIGFTLHYTRPRTPEDKPFIERWFSTLENQFVRRLPGNTGLDAKDLGDYDAANLAVATETDVEMLMHQYVLNVYNCSHHRGLNDVPERLWLEKTVEHEVTPYTNANQLEVLLGAFVERTPRRDGIRLFGLQYNGRRRNNFIEMIRSRAGAADLKKVRVRFDPYDLDAIWVQDPVTMKYEVVESEDPEYTRGLTLARHLVIRKRAAERIRGYISVHQLCLERDDMQREIEHVLGSAQASGRRTAYLLNGRRREGDEEVAALLARADGATNLDDILAAEFADEPPAEPKGRRGRKIDAPNRRTAPELISATELVETRVPEGAELTREEDESRAQFAIVADPTSTVPSTFAPASVGPQAMPTALADAPITIEAVDLPDVDDLAPLGPMAPATVGPGRVRLSLAERRAAAGMVEG